MLASHASPIEVAILGARGIPTSFTYSAGPWTDEARRGACVVVPLGRRKVHGVILGPGAAPAGISLREIAEVLPAISVPDDLLDLAKWATRYYRAPASSFLRAILPPKAVGPIERQIRTVAPPEGGEHPLETPLTELEQRILERVGKRGLRLGQLRKEVGKGLEAALRRLQSLGLIVAGDEVRSMREPERAFRIPTAILGLPESEVTNRLGRAVKQKEIFAFLRARAPRALLPSEIAEQVTRPLGVLRALEEKGLLESIPSVPSNPIDLPRGDNAPRQLNSQQSRALAALLEPAPSFQVFLLHGITGSGKTEVYLRAAERTLAAGRGVLILVPEISLTHQLVQEVYRRLGVTTTAVLHSELTDRERREAWHRVASGAARLVIGARSAVLAPLRNLGLVVVDEEHDTAYKQEESPRYNGRDMAIMRGKLAGCPVVLASATPSLESHQAALDGRYHRLELAERANAASLPTVEILDLRAPPPTEPANPASRTSQRSPLSPELTTALVENFHSGEQSVLFLNRRGFARALQCEACGTVVTCPDCSVSLTYHRARGITQCHHCGYRKALDHACPSCRCLTSARGSGTEQIEAAVRALLPAARIARLDRDTTAESGHLQRTLRAWHAGELDILVGTQMIAKGHDVPSVTLIGVVLADSSLSFPDFRSAERTFQLLAQVAGRAGRGEKPGRVLIQTYQPDHPSLVAARGHDFLGFAERELAARRELDYPPFVRLLRVIIEGDEHRAEETITRLAGELRKNLPTGIQLLGPAPAPIERLRGRHRFQLLAKGRSAKAIAELADRIEQETRPLTSRTKRAHQPDVRVTLDIDPSTMS